MGIGISVGKLVTLNKLFITDQYININNCLMSDKKYINSDRPTFDTNKENMHPNIAPEFSHKDEISYFPKISSFQIQQNSRSSQKLIIKRNSGERDWRKKILEPSER